jgi:DNA-directed RNA polymerase subunit M/transcription elongation factor TFIIS
MGVTAADFRSVSIAVILGSDSARFQSITKKGKQQTAKARREAEFERHTEQAVQRVQDRGKTVRKEQHERCPSCKSLETSILDGGGQNASLKMDEGNGTKLKCKQCKHEWFANKK